jgi:hypothetical protein
LYEITGSGVIDHKDFTVNFDIGILKVEAHLVTPEFKICKEKRDHVHGMMQMK